MSILESPTGVAVNRLGNVYVAERFGNVVRKVDAATGIISTVLGSGWPFYEGDGEPATSLGMGECYGVGLDAAGNLYVAEASGSRVHKVDASSRFPRTIAGQREEIYDYLPTYSGDNGPAVDALLGKPEGIAVSP